MPLSPVMTLPEVRCEPALSLPDKPCWVSLFFFFYYLSSVEGIQLPFSLKNLPKDGVGLLWLGAKSYCTNLFLIYVVQPNHQGCFFSPHRMWPCRRPASFFLFGCSTQISDRVGKKRKWLEHFDIYLYRTKCLRIKTEGRRHF